MEESMSSEDTSDRPGTEIETNVSPKASGRGGTVVIVAVLLALA
jgi:hypothetical protein